MTDPINELDFEKNHYDLFNDWQMNETKEHFISVLSQQSSLDKTKLPVLLSRKELMKRWNMKNRQSIFQATNKPNFPKPVLSFSDGKIPVYLETDIIIFEIENPWVTTLETRIQYGHWVLKNVIDPD